MPSSTTISGAAGVAGAPDRRASPVAGRRNSATTPWCTPPLASPIEIGRRHPAHAARRRARRRATTSATRALGALARPAARVTRPARSASSDRIDAVDQHRSGTACSCADHGACCSGCSVLSPGASLQPHRLRACARRVFERREKRRARSRQPRIVGRPALGGSSAPRSIAGTARSSSGPSASPVSATRIG